MPSKTSDVLIKICMPLKIWMHVIGPCIDKCRRPMKQRHFNQFLAHLPFWWSPWLWEWPGWVSLGRPEHLHSPPCGWQSSLMNREMRQNRIMHFLQTHKLYGSLPIKLAIKLTQKYSEIEIVHYPLILKLKPYTYSRFISCLSVNTLHKSIQIKILSCKENSIICHSNTQTYWYSPHSSLVSTLLTHRRKREAYRKTE